MTMQLQYWAATDVGKERDHNEDNFLIDKKLSLFVVADGMGGHAAGEVASNLAVHEVRDAVQANADLIERFQQNDPGVQRHELLAILEHAVQTACASVYKRAQADSDKRGMGTTCSLLLIAGNRGFIAHVGDSRIYLARQTNVHQLTEDHSLVNELVKRGKVKRDEIDATPYAKYKNAVTRAVGVYESVEVDTFDLDVLPGDSFLLCSDGLSHYLKEAELPGLLGAPDINNIPPRLVDLANAGGGHDNITAVVVRTAAHAAEGADARTEELSLKLEVLKMMPLFKHLSYKELVRIMNLTEVREYAPGERIISEGAPGHEMFVILSGSARLHKDEATITTLTRGAHFGEMALVDRSPRSASVTAEAEAGGGPGGVRLLAIRRTDFYELIRKEPQISVKLLWSFVQVLNQRLRKTTEDLSGVRRAEAEAEDMSDEVLFED